MFAPILAAGNTATVPRAPSGMGCPIAVAYRRPRGIVPSTRNLDLRDQAVKEAACGIEGVAYGVDA